MDLFIILVTVFLLLDVVAASEGELCYSQGGVAGIVIATFVVTLVLAGLIVFAYWYFKIRHSGRRNEEEDGLSQKVIPESESKYAFDNPYFKDDEVDKANIDDAEKGQAGLTTDNGTIVQQNSTVNALRNKKSKPMKGHPFSSVFHGVKKQRSRDDSYLAVEPERISVPLRGHDFTGLGFNICGNMRDGIFVKDVLHHGPASESGKIRAGDRILSVTVSFNNMVYEDALTILSYASPYNVHLELEKATDKSQVVPTSPGKRLGGSVSFRSGGQRLFHPLYRSQSIDDLTQIGKDATPNQELTPKRSQSIGLSANQKPRSYLRNSDSLPEEADKPAPILVSTMSLDEEALAMVTSNMQKSAAPSTETKVGDESSAVKMDSKRNDETKTKDPDSPISTNDVQIGFNETDEGRKSESDKEDDKPPQPYPRKGGTPGKRKAPAPPKPPHLNSSETIAQVHQTESNEPDEKSPIIAAVTLETEHSAPQIKRMKDTLEVDSLETGSVHEEAGSQSDVSNDSLELGIPDELRRKSSSLGDLTKLEEITSKKSPPSLLERAVSLDLKQESIPDSNLVTQKKILKPPDFEGDSTETDISVEQNGSTECGLKKWCQDSINADLEDETKSFNSKNKILDESQKSEEYFEAVSGPSSTNSSSCLSIPSDDETKTIKSTPVKKVIQPDSLLTTDLSLSQERNQNGVTKETTYKTSSIKNFTDNSLSVEIPVIPPVIKQLEKREQPSQPVVLQSYQASTPLQKEVIEISEKELDNIMMSHKQFLLKQAKATGVYSNLNPDSSKTDPEIEFESWSYTDDQNPKTVNGNGSDSAARTVTSELSDNDSAPLWKQSENAPLWKQGDLSREYTVRTSEGGYTKTVIIASPGDTSSNPDSPPPQLQPPYN